LYTFQLQNENQLSKEMKLISQSYTTRFSGGMKPGERRILMKLISILVRYV